MKINFKPSSALTSLFLLALLSAAPAEAQGQRKGKQPARAAAGANAASETVLWFIRENGKFGYIDQTGRVVIAPQYETTYGFSEGLAAVKLNGKYGYIDATGRLVIPAQFEDTYMFSEGLAWVKVNGQYAWIDRTGKVVIPPQAFEAVAVGFSDGMLAVKRGGKWGFMDRTGRVRIEPRFDKQAKFRYGVAQVHLDHKHSYIDREGRVLWSEK
jgi:hypothetical protein